MLKQLKLRKDLALKRAALDALLEQEKIFLTRSEELATALSESTTEEDTKLVGESIDTLETEMKDADIDTKKSVIEGEIAGIEKELAEIDERSKQTDPDKKPEQHAEREGKGMNKLQVREMLKTGAYYERAEVKEFYEKFKNLRAVGGEGLTIPEIVVNRILDILGDYSTLYPLVDKIRANGTTRILIDTDTSAATWIEQTGTLPSEDVGTITDISFDGFKIGKVTFVDNCMLQDSIINLDDYVTKKLARAISKGLDLAILKGTGSANKQPDGIIPKLAADHKVAVTTGKLVDILAKLALVDTGDDSVGEIIAVMKRATYYNRFLQYSINVDAKGNVVGKLPNLSMPDICGLKVVFNNNMEADTVLFGDYGAYTLVERETVTIDKSEHVKFAEDQMGFRGKGRFDGKPTKPNAFVLVTVTPA